MINFYVDKDNLITQQGRGGMAKVHCMWLLIKRLALPSYGHNRINSTTSTRLQRDFNEIVWSELSRSRAMRHVLFGVLIDVLHEKRFVDGLSFFFSFEHQTLKQIWIHAVIPWLYLITAHFAVADIPVQVRLSSNVLHPWRRARTWIWSQTGVMYLLISSTNKTKLNFFENFKCDFGDQTTEMQISCFYYQVCLIIPPWLARYLFSHWFTRVNLRYWWESYNFHLFKNNFDFLKKI